MWLRSPKKVAKLICIYKRIHCQLYVVALRNLITSSVHVQGAALGVSGSPRSQMRVSLSIELRQDPVIC